MDGSELTKRIERFQVKERENGKNPIVQAYTSIFLTSDIIENFVSNALSDIAVSRAGRNILYILIMNGGSLTATEISRHAWRTKYSTIRVIDTLEKDGYVVRTPTARDGDRRKKLVSITSKGIALSEKIIEISEEVLCYQVLGGLTEEQVNDLRDLLTSVGRHTFGLINQSESSYIYRNI